MLNTSPPTAAVGPVFVKETLVNGSPARIRCVEIGGQVFEISSGPITVVRLEDEWYEDITDPQAVITALRDDPGFRPDLFTFWQRMPDVEPKYAYHFELEDIAVLPITSYDHWWRNQIKSRTRNLIRKSEREGLVVREAEYDDEFVRGMTAIFNERPVRQGRKFWHYGKDFETVKRQFSRFLFREQMLGAYLEGEMIGFMMLCDAGRYGITGQIISSTKHRDKATNNALIARAVEISATRGWAHLIYYFWSDDSLAEFKRRCGFEKISVPRNYVPLSRKGEISLRLGAHRGWRALLPAAVKAPLKRARTFWYGLRDR